MIGRSEGGSENTKNKSKHIAQTAWHSWHFLIHPSTALITRWRVFVNEKCHQIGLSRAQKPVKNLTCGWLLVVSCCFIDMKISSKQSFRYSFSTFPRL